MKKYITYFLMAAALIGGATACNEDDLTKESSFDNMTPYRTAFDEWLLDNYVTPYNIDFKYKFEYKESDTDYNLAPAELSKSVAMAKLVKYLWIDAYVEVQGNNRDFICTYGPKMIHLIGSPAYDNGKITLGTAEGGLKVHEDFAELVANYVTHDAAWWQQQLKIADEGATFINQKMEIVRNYMNEVWNIDLDKLRDIVQRRSEQVKYIDLTELN